MNKYLLFEILDSNELTILKKFNEQFGSVFLKTQLDYVKTILEEPFNQTQYRRLFSLANIIASGTVSDIYYMDRLNITEIQREFAVYMYECHMNGATGMNVSDHAEYELLLKEKVLLLKALIQEEKLSDFKNDSRWESLHKSYLNYYNKLKTEGKLQASEWD